MPAPIVGVAAAAAARLVAKKLATKTAKKAVTSSARVRSNTNAVSKVAKPNAKPDVKTGGGLSGKKSVIKPGAGSAKETNYIQSNSVKVKQKGFEVEIQGKMYKTGGPAERKMAELRRLQSVNTVAKRATAPKRMK